MPSRTSLRRTSVASLASFASLASLAALTTAATLATGGCGGSSSSGFDTDGGSSSSGGGSSSGGSSSGASSSGGGSSGSGSGTLTGGSSGGSGGSSSGSSNGCSGAATDYVYVLSAQNDLYRFAPNLKQFTKIGPLQCNAAGLQPNSMAIDRNADAYVNYFGIGGGVLFKVSTQDASCAPAAAITLPQGWTQVGMGYSTIGTSANEALYVNGVGGAGGGGTGLGLVDFGKGTVGPIGPFSGNLKGASAELTGTGDGRLFGFFTTTPVYVAQIDKTSGATMTPVPMTGLPTPNDWAFSFWGGHFYLYTSQGASGAGGGSNVTDYDPTSGNINLSYMTSIGFDIVGAGVSTCAPTVPPQ